MPGRAPTRKPRKDPAAVLAWTPQGFRPGSATVARLAPTPRPPAAAALGLTHLDTTHVVTALKAGLPFAAFGAVQEDLGVSAQVLAATTQIAVRTLNRRRKDGRLQTDESERLYRVGALFSRAIEVLGDREAARQWFRTGNPALGDRSPLAYADTEPGAREVEDLLGRLEHGVFS